MVQNMEKEIAQLVKSEMTALSRPDLFRSPLISYSAAKDKKYLELKEIIGSWHLSPFELLPDAKSIISYFVPFTKKVVCEPKNVTDGSPLWAEAYEIINVHFGRINEVLSTYLIGLGFSAKAMPATHNYDPKDMKCKWSHKSAAAIAGLGMFGKNRLLITKKGSGGRFCSLLTSAPLQAEQSPELEKCHEDNSCTLCHSICPAKALSYDGIDKFACHRELTKNKDALIKSITFKKIDVCGKCASICPYAYIE